MKKLRCGVIGAGNMGKNHIRVYAQIAHLVAIADPIKKSAKDLAKSTGATYYSDFKEMLDIEHLDAVSVVVPTRLHKDIVIECLRRKIPTLVEKPIADNVKNAQIILEAAKKHKTLLMVGHIERFNPAVRKLRELVTSGKLGRIISLNSLRVGINPPVSPGSDVVLDLAIHEIDVFHYLLGVKPRRIHILKSKLYDRNMSDSAVILLSYPNAKGIIQANWVTPIKKRTLYATGTSGFVELDYINQKLIVYEKMALRPKAESFSQFLDVSQTPIKKIYISRKEPLREELTHFLKLVATKKTIDSTYALEALRIALG